MEYEVMEVKALFNEAYLHNSSSLRELLERFGVFTGDVKVVDCYEEEHVKFIGFMGFINGKISLIGYIRRLDSFYHVIMFPLSLSPVKIKGKSTSAGIKVMITHHPSVIVFNEDIINERRRRLRGLKKIVEEIRRARGNVEDNVIEELLGKLGVKVTSPNSLKSKVEPERVFGCTMYVEILFYDQSYHSPHMRILISMPRSIMKDDPYVHIMFYRNDVELEITPLVPTEISYSYSYPYSYKL